MYPHARRLPGRSGHRCRVHLRPAHSDFWCSFLLGTGNPKRCRAKGYIGIVFLVHAASRGGVLVSGDPAVDTENLEDA